MKIKISGYTAAGYFIIMPFLMDLIKIHNNDYRALYMCVVGVIIPASILLVYILSEED